MALQQSRHPLRLVQEYRSGTSATGDPGVVERHSVNYSVLLQGQQEGLEELRASIESERRGGRKSRQI